MSLTVTPYLRYVAKSTYFLDKEVYAKDSRLLYIIDGCGSFKIEGAEYDLTPGTLIYYPAYTPYHISADGTMLFYTLNFDFNTDRIDIKSPIIPLDCTDKLPSDNRPYIPSELDTVIYLSDARALEPYIKELYEESCGGADFATEAQSALIKLVLIKIARAKTTAASTLVERIKKTVFSNPRLNNTDTAAILGYHPYYINAVFAKHEGVSLHKFIMQARLSRAKELITSSAISLSQIAEDCGFSSVSHLCASVRKQYGISPSKMRKI